MLAKSVATPSDAQSQMVERTRLVRALMGGTAAMRAARETYLPREPAESVASYDVRLARTFLFNGFGKTVDDMTGKVFTKPVVLKDNVPEQLRQFAENIDLTGQHINVFARNVFHNSLQSGIGYLFVDMPRAVARPDGRPATLADEQRAGLRPYVTFIPLERMLGWKSEVSGGAEKLTQIRIEEWVSEPDGEYHEKIVKQIRVVEPGRWQTFRQNDKQEWVLHEPGTSSLQTIPLAPVYINRTGFMTGAPPLEKLAETNVAHWQSQSDQRNVLHVARVPILFGAGFPVEQKITVGASSAVLTSDVNAKLMFVEHTGAAIGAGDKDLSNLEFQMQTMGLQLLVPKPGGQTATGEIRDDAKENSPLAMMATALADALETALGFMAEYVGLGKDAGGEVQVNTDFGVQAGAGADLPQLIDAAKSGLISKETLWAELQRRGLLSDSFDPDVEKDRIASEAPEMSLDLGEGNSASERTGMSQEEADSLFAVN